MRIRRVLKWVGIGFVSLVALVSGVAAVLFSRVDFEALRPRVVAMASKALDQPVSMGSIKGHVFPRPSITVEDVRVGDEGREILFLTGLSAGFRFLPLLRGELEVEQVSGWEGHAVLDLAPSGGVSWGGMGTGKTAEMSPDGGERAALAGMLPAGVSLQDVAVILRQAGQPDVVVQLDRMAGRFGAEMRLVGSGQLSGQPLRIDMVSGNPDDLLRGHAAWPLDIAAVVGDLTVDLQGTLPPASGWEKPWRNAFSLMVDVHGHMPDFLPVLLGIPDPGDLKVSGRISAEDGQIKLSWLNIAVMGNALTGEVAFAPEATPRHFYGRLDANWLDMQTLKVLTSEVKGDGQGRAMPVRKGEAAEAFLKGLEDVEADFSLTSKHVELLSGHVIENLVAALRIEKGKLSLSPFALEVDGHVLSGGLRMEAGIQNWPFSASISQGSRELDVQGTLGWRGQALRMSGLQASLGNSDMTGDLVLDMSGERPDLDVRLSGSRLDLADLFLMDEVAETTEGNMGEESVLPSGPLPVLPDMTGKVDVRFDLVRAGREKYSNVALQGTFDPESATIGKLGVDLAGKPVAVSGRMSNRDGAGDVMVSGSVRNLDYGRLLKESGLTDLVSGQADIQFDLAGTGRTWADVRQSLKGKVSFIGGAGKIANGQLDLWASDLVAAMLPDLSKKVNDMTKVNCTVALWDVGDGKANLSDFLFDTGKITVRGSGGIDLASETLDIRLVPEPKGVSLVSMAPPVHVSGPLQAPKVEVQTAGSLLKGAVATGAVLGMVNPVGALATLVKKGTGEENPCAPYLPGTKK